MKIKISLLLTIAFSFLSMEYGVLCAQNVTSGSEEAPRIIKEEVIPEVSLAAQIEGHLLINGSSLYLNQINQEPPCLYKIIETSNSQLYSLLFSLVKEKTQENIWIRAILLGKVGKLSQNIISDTLYSDGSPASIEVKAFTFIFFEVTEIKKVSEVSLSDVPEIKMDLLPAVLPEKVTKQLKHIKGKIITANFRSVVPRIEIQGEKGNKPTILIIPSYVRVQKVIEGQTMSFFPRGQLKVVSKIEVWYQEKGRMNIAQIISILSTE